MWNPNNPPREIPINMLPSEKIVAVNTTTQMFYVCHLAMQLTPDQVALMVKLQGEIAKHELIGPARDIPELNGRIVRAFAEWHARLCELMPALREISERPPITDADIRWMKGS